MKTSKALAVAVAIAIPLFAVFTGFAPLIEAPRLALLSSLPLILVFKPKFVTDYFGQGFLPTLLGWTAFTCITFQIFIVPFLVK